MDPIIKDAIAPGSDVRSSDGEKLGSVSVVHDAFIRVEKGFIFHKDFHVPLTAIARIDPVGHHVTLNVTKEQALASDWETHDDDNDAPPNNGALDGATVMSGFANQTPAPDYAELEEDPKPILSPA